MTAPAFSMLTFQILFACFADWKGADKKRVLLICGLEEKIESDRFSLFFPLRLDLVIIFTKFY